MKQQGDEGVATERAAMEHINPALLSALRQHYPDAFPP
jgi:hypothetical protein